MDRENDVHMHNGILLSLKKCGILLLTTVQREVGIIVSGEISQHGDADCTWSQSCVNVRAGLPGDETGWAVPRA